MNGYQHLGLDEERSGTTGIYRDARVSRIYAGTSEIMCEVIGRSL